MKHFTTIPRLALLAALLATGACQRDDSTFAQAPPSVTRAEIAGVVVAEFPKGSVYTPSATIRQVTAAATNAVFDQTAQFFRVSSRLPYHVVINIGPNRALNDNIKVTFTLPAAFKAALPNGHGFELFAQLFQAGGDEVLDNFDIIPSVYRAGDGTLVALLPATAFSNARTADNSYEAILTLGTTPGENVATSLRSPVDPSEEVGQRTNATGCKAGYVVCPIGSESECSGPKKGSPFGARIHPITLKQVGHKGQDYRVAVGTSVTAVAKGRVLKIGNDTRQELVEGQLKTIGWGTYLVVQHDDESASLYAHLSSTTLAPGSPINAGQELGKSGNSGGSTGPHLHLEYFPNGYLTNAKERVDPAPCIGSGNATGSITVQDNGTAADDAFAVYLENVLIGVTQIGGANSIALSNIRPGDKQLRVVCTIAPDNVGTYLITLQDGITFKADGSSSFTSTMPQGGARTWVINVPTSSGRPAGGQRAPAVFQPNAYIETTKGDRQ